LKEGPSDKNIPEQLNGQMTEEQIHQGTNWNGLFEGVILILIVLSSILLAWDNPLMDPESDLKKTLGKINMVFTVLFTMEVTVRIIAQGFWSNQLFHIDPYLSSVWNMLDLIIVVTSVIDLVASLLHIGSNMGAVKAMRSLRALRPLRVIKS